MPPIPTPTQGTAATLFALSHTAKLDLQGYIIGQYKAETKIGHEYTHPTGTRFVFFLRLAEEVREEVQLSEEAREDLEAYIGGEDDDTNTVSIHCSEETDSNGLEEVEGVCMEDYDDDDTGNLSTIQEEDEDETGLTEPELSFNVDINTTTSTATTAEREQKRKTRLERNTTAPSLACLMATARPDDFPISNPPDSDEDLAATSSDRDDSKHVAYTLENDFTAAFDEENSGFESDEDPTADLDSDDDLPTSRATNEDKDTVLQHGKSTARPLQRHNGAVTLATLIARAESAVSSTSPSPSPFFSSSSSTSLTSAQSICFDPHFPGHNNCLRRDQDSHGLSIVDAFAVLRERFDVRQEGVGTGMRKAWHLKKREMRGGMVYGGSGLRFEVFADDGEEIEFMSSPLPTMTYGDELASTLSSSFDVDVDGLDASGFWDSDDGEIEESSSLFDELIEEYDDRLISEKTSCDDVHLAAPKNLFQRHNTSSSSLDLHYDAFSRTPLHNASSKDDLEVRYAGSSLHNTISTDSLSNTSSVRTLLFSNHTSLTSILTVKTSCSSVRSVYSRLIDALDLEIDKHKCQDGCSVCITALRGFSIANINVGRLGAVTTSSEKRVVSLPVVPIPAFVGVQRKEELQQVTLLSLEQANKSPVRRRIVSLPVVSPEVQEQDDMNNAGSLLSEADDTIMEHSPPRPSFHHFSAAPDTPDRIGNTIDNFLTYITTTTSHGSIDKSTINTTAFQHDLSLKVLDCAPIDLSLTLDAIHSASNKTHPQVEADVDAHTFKDRADSNLLDTIPRASRRRHWAAKLKQKATALVPRNVEQFKKHCVEGVKDIAVGVACVAFGGFVGYYMS